MEKIMKYLEDYLNSLSENFERDPKKYVTKSMRDIHWRYVQKYSKKCQQLPYIEDREKCKKMTNDKARKYIQKLLKKRRKTNNPEFCKEKLNKMTKQIEPLDRDVKHD